MSNFLVKHISLLFFFLLLIGCQEVEIAIELDTNTSGTFSYGYTLGLESLSLLDIDSGATPEALFPFSIQDFFLLGRLIDGMEILQAESGEQADGSIVVSAEYTFSSLHALNEMLAYMGISITSATRGKRQILTIKGITVGVPEVDQVNDIKGKSRLSNWNQLRFAKVMFPDLQIRYQITAPEKIVRTTRGNISGKQVVVEDKIENFSDDPARYSWNIQW